MKILHLLLVMTLTIFLTACGSDNSDAPTGGTNGKDNTTSDPTDNNLATSGNLKVSFKNGNTTALTTNNQVVTVQLLVFNSDNTPYSDGKIKIVYPNKAVTGIDVGTFDAYEKDVKEGKATFSYTAPADLKARIAANDISTQFGFYHTEDKNTTLQSYTFNYTPAEGQAVLNDYELKNSSSSTSIILGLESSTNVAFFIQDKTGTKVIDQNIESITVKLMNPNFAILKNTYSDSGSTLSFTGKNNISVGITSNTKSGIVPIRVTAVFKDGNNVSRTLESTYSLIILSGPPTAISMSYIGTSNQKNRAKFIEKWAISVTDKYNNLVNTNPSVSMGMIAGFAKSTTSTKPYNALYFTPEDTISGTLSGDGLNTHLTATNAVFGSGGVDINNDVLVTFGKDYKFSGSGKWDIETITSSKLTLKDQFTGANIAGLGFAVGHNFRDETCDFGRKALGMVYPSNNNYIIDASGTMEINVEYDYYLTGKSVMLWVNMVGDHNANVVGNETVRIGHSQKVNLRGLGLDGGTHSFAEGQTGTVHFPIQISDTTEWYKNANFAYKVTVTGAGNTYTVTDSMLLGVASCNNNNGVAYVDVTITAAPADGTVTVSNVLTSREF